MRVTLLSICLLAFSPALATAQSIQFGDNSSEWANDGECDDRRFYGSGMDNDLDRDDNGHDANDCRTAYNDGRIKVWDRTAATAATQCNAIRYGNNTSEWARDDECDDPRFEGPGTSSVVITKDLGKDAQDCKAACIAGNVALRDY